MEENRTILKPNKSYLINWASSLPLRCFILPVQFPLVPSPVNPDLHEQENVPTKLVQLALVSQL